MLITVNDGLVAVGGSQLPDLHDAVAWEAVEPVGPVGNLGVNLSQIHLGEKGQNRILTGLNRRRIWQFETARLVGLASES